MTSYNPIIYDPAIKGLRQATSNDTLVGVGSGGGGGSGGVQVAKFSIVNGSLICQSLTSMQPSLVNGNLIITMDSLT